MINKFMRLVMLFGVVLLSILSTSCGGGGGGGGSDSGSSPPDSLSSAAPPEIPEPVEPPEISESAIAENPQSAFAELKIDGDFTFTSQRMVDVDIVFPQHQAFTSVSIFSGLDPITGIAINLLEQAELYNAIKYRSSLTVPTSVNSLHLVVNGDFYAELELVIARNNRVHYIFE